MRRWAVVLGVVAAGMWPAPALAQTASVVETGWWSNRVAATPVGDGGFEVALSLSEPTSVAAIRVAFAAPSLSRAVLHLTETTGGLRSDAATVRVCPTSSAWSPADPGGLEDAPVPDCGVSVVQLERDPQAGTWRGEVSELLAGQPSPASLMVVPSPDDALPLDVGFQVRFAQAAVEASPGPAGQDAPVSGGPEPSDVDDDGVSTRSGTAPPVSFPPAPPPAGPNLPAQAAEPEPAPFAETNVAAAGRDGPDRPWGRLAAFVPLSLLVATGAAAARNLLARRGLLQD